MAKAAKKANKTKKSARKAMPAREKKSPKKASPAAKSKTATKAVNSSVKPAVRGKRLSKCFYLLELSVEPGGAQRSDVFAYSSPEHIRECLEQEFLTPDADARELAAYLAVWYGETIKVSTVDNGRVVKTLDLHPFIRVRIGDGPLVALTESRAYKETWPGDGGEPLGKPVYFELDWLTIRGQLPALTGTKLMPGDECVIAGEELRYGRNDFEDEDPDD